MMCFAFRDWLNGHIDYERHYDFNYANNEGGELHTKQNSVVLNKSMEREEREVKEILPNVSPMEKQKILCNLPRRGELFAKNSPLVYPIITDKKSEHAFELRVPNEIKKNCLRNSIFDYKKKYLKYKIKYLQLKNSVRR